MSDAALTLVILFVGLICFMIPRIPISVTSLALVSALGIAGIITFPQAYAGFSSGTTIMVVGLMILGQACFETGLVAKIAGVLRRFTNCSEKQFLLVAMIVTGVLTVFLNCMLVILLVMPILDEICAQSNGKFRRKLMYMPCGFCAMYASFTTLNPTSIILGANYLTQLGFQQPGVFAIAPVKLPPIILFYILYMLFGYKLSVKFFKFEEIPVDVVPAATDGTEGKSKAKMILSGVILLGVIIGMICGVNTSLLVVLGTILVILTGCVGEKAIWKTVNWPVICLISASSGLTTAMQNSGACDLLADIVLNHSGPLAGSAFAMCCIALVLSALLSNFMSNTAAVAVLLPIVYSIAQGMGTDPIPFVFAASIGGNSAIATPLATPILAVTQKVGYKFTDFVKLGGIFNVIFLILLFISYKIVYFL